jgi:hypothetical protein
MLFPPIRQWWLLSDGYPYRSPLSSCSATFDGATMIAIDANDCDELQ